MCTIVHTFYCHCCFSKSQIISNYIASQLARYTVKYESSQLPTMHNCSSSYVEQIILALSLCSQLSSHRQLLVASYGLSLANLNECVYCTQKIAQLASYITLHTLCKENLHVCMKFHITWIYISYGIKCYLAMQLAGSQ